MTKVGIELDESEYPNHAEIKLLDKNGKSILKVTVGIGSKKYVSGVGYSSIIELKTRKVR